MCGARDNSAPFLGCRQTPFCTPPWKIHPILEMKKYIDAKTDPIFYLSHPILNSPQIGRAIMGSKTRKKIKKMHF
jgi:hypothetical protein